VGRIAEICGKIIWASVFLYAFFLPWGVSGTQIAFAIGLLAWIVKIIAERGARWVGCPATQGDRRPSALRRAACRVAWPPARAFHSERGGFDITGRGQGKLGNQK
jgi:hypothetical protein